MTEAKKKTRRRYGIELKQQILADCAQHGASVAGVAPSHDINANVVHKWHRQACDLLPDVQAPAFVTVSLQPPVTDARDA